MPKHILIPTDGSETAQRGVDYGLALARNLGAKATILTCTDPYPLSGLAVGAGWIPSEDELNAFNKSQAEAAGKVLQAVRTAAASHNVETALLHASDARPATAILQTAEACGADLIVMGSHGRRGVDRLLLGSQTAEVLARATIPVLVVK
ncbi:MAG: universal stress protein [Mesorhizobium sp.]|nr:universal stress protein [Mesorhizobium sp.]MBN9244730.1 universal stress protein [Mesorhizobium sp.]